MNLQYPYGNHIGEKFGHLLAVAAIETDPNTGDPVIYDCKCMKCGKEHVHVLDRDLLSYKVRCCQDCNPHDLIGMRFTRWTVLERHPTNDKFNKICWLCKCDCGKTRILSGNSLLSRHTQSCGCFHKERVSSLFLKDLTGQTFGRLTVIKRVENSNPMPTCPGGVVRYECKCECGKTCVVTGATLRNGTTKSCGCLHRDLASKLNFKDLSGKRFGRLLVIERVPNDKKIAEWKCKCDCGNICIVKSGSLIEGHTRSCGCLQRELARIRSTKWKPEDLAIVRRLHGMKSRCYNTHNERYPMYGGRGITVCDEWLKDARSFVEWSKSHGFRNDLTIDRIDVDGPYSPENCRWVDNLTQANNKQKSHSININTVKHIINTWASSSGKTYEELMEQLCDDHEFFTSRDMKKLNTK